MRRTQLVLAFALSCAACATSPPRPEPAGEATALPALPLATDEITGSFLLRQRLQYRWREQAGSFDAAVQNACGELTVVLLTPFGTRAGWIRQRGRNVESESGAMPLPFAPMHILRDVQRSYLIPVVAPPGGADTSARWIGGELLTEIWRDGSLVERVFDDGARGERLRVRYPRGVRPGALPVAASLEAEPAGYTLDVETVSRTEIACGA